MQESMYHEQLGPMDAWNKALLKSAHPGDWRNPKPKGIYRVVVLGSGTAGLVAASICASLGASVALVEQRLMGGDCLNFGCVPSKSLIRSSRAMSEIQRASAFGIGGSGTAGSHSAPLGGAVMERLRRLRAEISPNDSAERFRKMGVDVFFGQGRFLDRQTLEVDGERLHFRKAIIATGSRPAVPKIPGLAEAGFLTNETVFSLTEIPEQMAVIGGGPIGCELAQAFRRLGAEVTIVGSEPRLLSRNDLDASAIIERIFCEEGIEILVSSRVVEVKGISDRQEAQFEKTLLVNSSDGKPEVRADAILVAIGRKPNVENMDLEKAGVEYDAREGVVVNDGLQTANPAIFAAGDICSKYKFTHVADFMARVAARNALFPFLPRQRFGKYVIPWCMYTDPELAQTGAVQSELEKMDADFEVVRVSLGEIDRAILDGETEGFLKVLIDKKGHIMGGTLVARHAGEMISELTLAISQGLKIGALGQVIHPYPTQAEVFRKAADMYGRKRLTPMTKKIMSFFVH